MAVSLALVLSTGNLVAAFADEPDLGVDDALEQGVDAAADEAVDGDDAYVDPGPDLGDDAILGDPDAEPDPDAVVDPEPDDTPIGPLASTYPYHVTYDQKPNGTTVTVALPNLNLLLMLGVTSVRIDATMSYKGVATRSVNATVNLSTLTAANKDSFEMSFGDYGRFTAVARFYAGSTLVQTGDSVTVGITADEYNIAPVSATLPLSFFSIALFGDSSIRYTGAGQTGDIIPTIILLERPGSYDWDHLPEGVYGLPYVSKADLAYQPGDFAAASDRFRGYVPAMADYVKDLYTMNPAAKFNLYCVDYYVGIIQQAIYANRIPAGQYTITVMSDGAFSYNKFAEVYAGSNPSSTHSSLIAGWNAAKAAAYANGSVSSGFSLNLPQNCLYAAVAAEASSGAEWWLARKSDTLHSGDSDAFAITARDNPRVVAFSIANRLAALNNADRVAFKALYNFSDSYFAEAESSGKDIMMFLGTTIWLENGLFADYARFTMAFYGDDYIYYYKGHPGTPTGSYPEKQAELDALGVTDIDSSVPAELILFFYPELFLSGYNSSTYASVPVGMGKFMFNMTRDAGLANPQYANMDAWISPVTDSTAANIKSLCQPAGNRYYLVEFSDPFMASVSNEYTIAIWDATANTIAYYKLVGSSYQFVKKVDAGSIISGEGLFTISSKSVPWLVVDVAGGSSANGANIQVWSNNHSPAQTFRFTAVGGGYYTIRNVATGKYIDVSGAKGTPGTNVHQWQSNGTDAQRWKPVATNDGDGSYYLMSACGGLYLDMQHAGTTAGTNLWIYTPNGSGAQKFFLNKVVPTVTDGTYNLTSALSTSSRTVVLDVSAASSANGANIQVWQSNGTGAQQFKVAYDPATGYYTITNVNSNKAVDVAGANSASTTNVWQWERSSNNRAQMWRFVLNTDGTFTIYSATGNGCVLDVRGAQNANGTNVWIYTPSNNNNAQKWRFTPLP
jgi:hypothetical protein